MAHAAYRVSQRGYAVEVYGEEGELLAWYTGGNHPTDSQVTIPNGLPIPVLLGYARQTAREMLNEAGLKGPIVYDKEIDAP